MCLVRVITSTVMSCLPDTYLRLDISLTLLEGTVDIDQQSLKHLSELAQRLVTHQTSLRVTSTADDVQGRLPFVFGRRGMFFVTVTVLWVDDSAHQAVMAAITPELTGMSSVAKGPVSIPASDANLPLCDDLPPPTSSTVEQQTCIVQLNADALSVAPSENVTASPADGLTCAQDVIAPSLTDAQSLCNNIVPAGQFTVAAAPANNQCTCIQFSSVSSSPS